MAKRRPAAAPIPANAVHPLSLEEWRAWLLAHHTQTNGIWLVTNKKETGLPRIEYDEAVAEALCYGWVDSKPNTLDDTRSLLWFAPRKPGTGWSRPNKERIARMQAAGRMHPAGQAKVDAAIADGTWTKLDAVENLEIPADLQVAFVEHPPTAQHFEAFPRSVKRGILEWILNAKRPETRRERIQTTTEKAAVNERANQWKNR
jgi:uncharacterized protein YdeI (YjbR/CyaY-like superfamily)